MYNSVNPSSRTRGGSRESILRAAGASFAKRGYADTRMTAIATAAGISRTALYKHFPTKADLLIALNEYVIRDWEEWMDELAESSRSAGEFLDVWIREGLSDSWRRWLLSTLMALLLVAICSDLRPAKSSTTTISLS